MRQVQITKQAAPSEMIPRCLYEDTWVLSRKIYHILGALCKIQPADFLSS